MLRVSDLEAAAAPAAASFDVKALEGEFQLSRGSVGGPGPQEAGAGFDWAALFSAPPLPAEGGEDSYVFTAERMVVLSVDEEFSGGEGRIRTSSPRSAWSSCRSTRSSAA